VDNVLNKGVVLTVDLTIALAQVDLVYARLSLLLCAADSRVAGRDDRRHRAPAGGCGASPLVGAAGRGSVDDSRESARRQA
jgi:hypothetical protein